jgi:hypothetical protein
MDNEDVIIVLLLELRAEIRRMAAAVERMERRRAAEKARTEKPS